MRAPTRVSPSWDDPQAHLDWSSGLDLSVYPTGPDDEPDEPEPALYDAKGAPLFVAKPPFGFGLRP